MPARYLIEILRRKATRENRFRRRPSHGWKGACFSLQNACRRRERMEIVTRRVDRTTQKVGKKYHVWHTDQLWEVTKDLPVIEIEIESLKHVDPCVGSTMTSRPR